MALVLRVAALAVLAVVACTPSDDFEVVSAAGGTAGSAGGTGAKDAGSGGFGALGGVGASGGVGGSGGAAGAAGASGGTAGAGGASGAAGSASIPTCDALFTGVVGVNQVCTEEAGNCVLAADTDALDGDPGQTCGAICAAAGAECVQIFDNAAAGYCTPETTAPLGCTTTADQSNAVCYCSRGCGGGPPCASATTCSSGQCI